MILNKKAFTLAEVLITLGIIGVVAALTLPTLIQNYKEKQTVTAVKEAYSMFSQALLRMTLDYPDLLAIINPEKTNGENSDLLMKELSKYLKTQKICYNEAGAKNCMKERYLTLTGGLGSSSYDNQTNVATAILANGMVFWVTPGAIETVGHFGIDINGNKKPNKLGEDLFVFFIYRNGKIKLYDEYSKCNIDDKTAGFNGYACGSWIIRNDNMDYLRYNINQTNTEENNETDETDEPENE